ncbi:MAG: hypothetical protein H6721_25670 [Sandaracinus sp.]|nr:hypothetical protein [Sandaracinus sp.]MCB9625561.1 hypothetical protein [Sandaracinus sp.]MCB9635521.1 hypothetical protein [Sandaracinus sp.]
MPSAIHHLTILHYPPQGGWTSEDVIAPTWSRVEQAIRRMDDVEYPIVQLHPSDDDEEGASFHVLGGNGRWVLFDLFGAWQYEDPKGGDADVRLWQSDQGYFCKERNLVHDVDRVLRITKAYFDTASYEEVDRAARAELARLTPS